MPLAEEIEQFVTPPMREFLSADPDLARDIEAGEPRVTVSDPEAYHAFVINSLVRLNYGIVRLATAVDQLAKR